MTESLFKKLDRKSEEKKTDEVAERLGFGRTSEPKPRRRRGYIGLSRALNIRLPENDYDRFVRYADEKNLGYREAIMNLLDEADTRHQTKNDRSVFEDVSNDLSNTPPKKSSVETTELREVICKNLRKQREILRSDGFDLSEHSKANLWLKREGDRYIVQIRYGGYNICDILPCDTVEEAIDELDAVEAQILRGDLDDLIRFTSNKIRRNSQRSA